MNRRELLLLLPVLALPVATRAAGEKVYRVGELDPSASSAQLTRKMTIPELASV